MGSKRRKEQKQSAAKPSFDESALARLTSKIDKSLADSEKARTPERKRKRGNEDGHSSKRRHTDPSVPESQTGRPNERSSKQAPTLLDEILALGGNEDDLELVANVDSGDEGADGPRPKAVSDPLIDDSLRDEIAKFASTLGFAKFRETEDPDTDDDSDEDPDTDDDSEVLDTHDAAVLKPRHSAEDAREAAAEGISVAPPPQEARLGKQANKLVRNELPGRLTEAHLIMWAFEDWLKRAYFRIIGLLEIWCSDEIEYSRSRALDFVFGLLKNKPEQEANLLRLLVNKIGDRERKIASRASYLILQLLNIHPGMKAIVIGTVEQEVLLKPGQSLRTKYTAINTLNQTILSTREPAIADMLLRIYFDVFLSLLKTGCLGGFEADDGDKRSGRSREKPKGKGGPGAPSPGNEQEINQKLVSSLLTGVNRAVPFASSEDSTLERHLDTLFRITHSSNFNTSVQALMLIQQLTASKQLAVDRFYRTLYESLLDPRLVTSSKHALYLNLLFRALKNDVDVRRVKAFVKRLIQVLSLHQPSFTCGALFLIAELEATFPDLHTLLDEAEDNDDDGEEVLRDVREDGPQAEFAPQSTPGTSARRIAAYDGRKRDPGHSNAHRSCLWELVPFFSHYHPSVGVFAANLLARQRSVPKPDLASHTLMHFLDKFVYRNPKAEESKRGGSIMQPMLGSGGASQIVASSKAAARQMPVVNSASFWNLRPDQVSAEDVFFHEYFARVGKPGQAARAAKKAVEKRMEPNEEAAEEEIWEALVNSQPEIEGADPEEDSDMDLEEYDYSDNDVLVDGPGAEERMSDFGSDGAEGDAGFEGIFDDSEDDGEDMSSNDESVAEVGKGQRSKQGRKGRLSRKEIRSLPTFASADDYAEMLAAEDDGLDE
ncbi:c851615e-6678-40a1-aeb3-6c1f3d48bafe [Thermothielavioides terrestris]|uniref:C851615e-6678-40a1-aeb3-6c1f3d48bafe n=1 Tax=Thermothielavioides terrestris TaxID=2587410 RepID=A0A446B8V2_9PEZI|nr:c851615e-6678-40a1-aeb3-6c1f3d48bafe [Thermothielavioides terrestris]